MWPLFNYGFQSLQSIYFTKDLLPFISSNAPHIHFVADTIGALGWIVSGDRPSHFIRESYDGGKHHVKNIPGEKNNKDR